MEKFSSIWMTVWSTRNVNNANSFLFTFLPEYAVHVNKAKVIMQGKLFQRCTHLLYCSVLSLCGNVNTRRMLQPDMGSIFQWNQWNILVVENYYVNYQNYQIQCSSDTKRTLMHLFLFTNTAQRELVSICTQSIHDRN